MAAYNEKQKTAVSTYIESFVPDSNIYLKEAVKKIALENMNPENNDEEVADSIINYINDYFSDKGNIVYAESFQVIPKTVLYVARNDIIAILKKNREGKAEPLTITLSCGSSTELTYGEGPDEPVTITALLSGGDNSEFYTVKSIECPTAVIEKITENKYNLTFSTPGQHTIIATASRLDGKEQVTTNLTVKNSKNDPPKAISIGFSKNPVNLVYGDTPNDPVTVTATIKGGEDPEGKPVKLNLTCPTAQSVEKKSDREYELTFNKTGSHIVTATSTDNGNKTTTGTGTITVNAAKNESPTPISIAFSKTSPATMSGDSFSITVTLSGGTDPEGKGTTKTVTCPTASKITKKSTNIFEVTFTKVGTHVITATATDPTGLFTTNTANFQVNPEKNDPPTPMTLTLSATTVTLGTGAAAEQTVTVNIAGGVDPEGKAVTKTVECTTAKNITKVNDNQWKVTFDSVRMHVIIATATDPIGLKSVQTATVDVKGQSQSSASQTMQFTDAKFDSGWSDRIPGCYVSGVTLSLVISSGHSSSNDYLVILGKKSDGTIVILRDNFNTANRFKEITAGTEVNNTIYTKGNLSSTTWKWTKDPYTVEDDIREVRFVCETPGHADCAKSAKVTFNMDYTYDPSMT